MASTATPTGGLLRTRDAIRLPGRGRPAVEARAARRDAYPIHVTRSEPETVERVAGLIGAAGAAVAAASGAPASAVASTTGAALATGVTALALAVGGEALAEAIGAADDDAIVADGAPG